MGDTLRKVKSGDAIVIPARTFNTFIDAARQFQDSAQDATQGTTPTFRRTGIVLVKNISGSDCDRFYILGIDGPIFTPTDSEIARAFVVSACGQRQDLFFSTCSEVLAGQRELV